VSLLITTAWFTSLAGATLLRRSGVSGLGHFVLMAAVLAASALIAWRVAILFVRTLHRFFPDEPGPSRQDFVGMTCTIRTGRVDGTFGQAEVTARDGSTAVVQVRQTGADVMACGSSALLYAYDDAGEFFLVAPYAGLDGLLDPRTPAA
jgi:hypothetical protein